MLQRPTALALVLSAAIAACGSDDAANGSPIADAGDAALASDTAAPDPLVDSALGDTGTEADGGLPVEGGDASGDAGAGLFPLRVAPDKNTLVDASGRPFLIVGDAAWSLVAELTTTEAIRYLDDRKSRGFNTVLVNLIEHKFTSHTPAWKNAAGDPPFASTADFSVLDEAYFAHVDEVLRAANDRGILVLLAPSYMGYACGDEGWCAEMKQNGTAKLAAYGQAVGRRHANTPNILWVEGGDHTPATTGSPSELDLVNAVATGIRGADGVHLHTAHWGEISAGEGPVVSWLGVDSTYSYAAPALYPQTLKDRARDVGARPFFFIEGSYENEHSSPPVQLRAQMYQPVLSGSSGFVFGLFPMWSFWKPGAPPWMFDDGAYPGGWTTALATPGAKDVTNARALFSAVGWSGLAPDTQHALVTAGFGQNGTGQYALAAKSADGRAALVYFTASLTVTVDLTRLTGTSVRARWFDPSSGAFRDIVGSPFVRSGTKSLGPSPAAADGAPDAVLVLEGM